MFQMVICLIFKLPFYATDAFLFYIDFSLQKKKVETAVIFYICWYPPFPALSLDSRTAIF